jgi:hypothetical protein
MLEAQAYDDQQTIAALRARNAELERMIAANR